MIKAQCSLRSYNQHDILEDSYVVDNSKFRSYNG